jgi:ABC-type Na+ transport system ATPase subunit NatA
LFLNAQLSFCYWISTIFSRSKTAAIVGVMMYFAGYVINTGVKNSQEWVFFAASSLHPVAAFTVGLEGFVEYEDSQIGVTFFTWDSTSAVHGFTFKDSCTMLGFDIFFWAFMTWYCEKVFPSEWGTHEPVYFIFNPYYWFGWMCKAGILGGNGADARSFLTNLQGDGAGNNVQGVSDELMDSLKQGRGIFVKDLRKSFNTTAGVKHAVDGLDLNMFDNQITCLLGHNGAGKTTTIGMLTGLIDATSGMATVNGKDVFSEMSEIRKDLGVCPQHDILYPDLTVREHLRLFAVFKGVPSDKIEGEINHMIREVGLVEKADAYSKTLSGGMKRKLSVGIAFIGGSKVVLLDEPTSGMDPYSRRFTWNVIRNMKENRTIILTTHFMDEVRLPERTHTLFPR